MTVRKIVRCIRCGNAVGADGECEWGCNPEGVCGECGYPKTAHSPECYRHRHEPQYPAYVTRQLNPVRPKYNEAVKSIAAFANDERKFLVLVGHLNDACIEVSQRSVALARAVDFNGHVENCRCGEVGTLFDPRCAARRKRMRGPKHSDSQ